MDTFQGHDIVSVGYCQLFLNCAWSYDMTETLLLPERLKKIREDRGLTKAEAARLLGLSKMGYLRYESAARIPSYQMIVFMAQKLKTSPDYLIGAVDDPAPKEYCISKTDDPALFDLISDVIDKNNPTRDRLLSYYKRMKSSKIE